MMELATFENNSQVFTVSQQMKMAFRKYGFILIRNLFTKHEMSLLWDCFDTAEFKENMFTRSNGGDDTAGLVSRSRRVVGTMMELLGEDKEEDKELYLLSSKLIAKAPQIGGEFAWHQDYGYFYENGVLFPDCGSVSIPLHRCWRSGDLASVDQERLDAITKVLGDPVCVETEPGDVLFFHSNLLHTSGPNVSREKRWNLVLAYNQIVNAPYHNSFLQRPETISIVEDGDVVEKNRTISSIDKNFILNKEDNTTETLEDELS